MSNYITIALDTNWEFRSYEHSNWHPASVPGFNFTDLYKLGQIEDPFYRDNEKKLQWIEEKDWEYRVFFEVKATNLEYENIDLIFEGLDTYADVYLNNQLILNANNMFRGWSVAAKKHLKSGKNELRVYFHSPIHKVLPLYEESKFVYPAENEHHSKKLSVFTRKAPYHYGWDWGPRFVTSGIWRKVYLNCWNQAKFENIQTKQTYLSDYQANIDVVLEIYATSEQKAEVKLKNAQHLFAHKTQTIQLKKGLNQVYISLEIQNPKRWWTNGLGEAFLYQIDIELFIDYKVIDTRQTRIGLRTLEVINQPDEFGESFYFKLNGVPVFMKGVNYIPANSFMSELKSTDYQSIIKNVVDANMNMLRIWGGGVYEDDYFYDLADEQGILIWQDFMFGCTMYPGDADFLENVRQEAIYNIKRLRNHPCLALWCGNNEISMGWRSWNWQENFAYSAEIQTELWTYYESLFHHLLPKLVQELDESRFYLSSSPISLWDKPEDFTKGDNHYWGVWHGERPFSSFKTHIPRFMSEFGFQAYPAFQSVQKYTLPEDWQFDSEAMKVHQKHARGFQLIKSYMDQDYYVPQDFADFLYVGQVLQAEGMKIGLEAHRRAKPYCQGTLYWQLNDCWPVASWSSVDYYGNWKALHYFVKKAFQAVLISPIVEDNRLKVYIISDKLKEFKANLNIVLYHLHGEILFQKNLSINVPANRSKLFFAINIDDLLSDWNRNEVVLSVELIDNQVIISNNILYFVPTKHLNLRNPTITYQVKTSGNEYLLYLKTNYLAKNVFLSFSEENKATFDDNYFDLLPNQEKIITINSSKDAIPIKSLIIKSLSDTYINAFTLD